ncbi:vWA domain-containing protein [uncultured Microbacterium sp.]|uniref:vWA domain-containing protein n=1 Tax=uncultured Microbacterium sp. TaxID=191216 RepID=UPI0028D8848C|nr:vWA domain-containing protein [uncultured Microbacterium sp.]
MSHNTGTIHPTNIAVGPRSGQPGAGGTWTHDITIPPANGGPRYVLLHFASANLPGGDRIEVDLGYDTDVFTAGSNTRFWTRPIDIPAAGGPGGKVRIRVISGGGAGSGAVVDMIGVGEALAGTQDPSSMSNSDPFLRKLTAAGVYAEPKYDPYWFAHTPPWWANVEAMPAGHIGRQVAPSVGMIVSLHSHGGHMGLSTCSVTLIGPDLAIMAGHCIEDLTAEIESASVTFDYETSATGARPAGYAPVFHKVVGYRNYRWNDAVKRLDYVLLQLAVPQGGIQAPVVQVRNTLPAVGEKVFGIHHPNGAVKKISPDANLGWEATVKSVVADGPARNIYVSLDVSGGSSGSGLFDMQGRFLGTLSNGSAGNLAYCSSLSILDDIATPPTPLERSVVLVMDRSGSMSQPALHGTRTKLQEARDAASLFVQLVRSNSGNRIGMVSFSTAVTSPEDFSMRDVNGGAKNQLVGGAPYSGGKIGALVAGGNTAIGQGLQKGRGMLSAETTPTAILLLTDGQQNVKPDIQTVSAGLAPTTVHAIGFGSPAQLDGPTLSRLVQQHGGLYTHAGNGLQLRKFFALAFGDIFESGTLKDPDYVLRSGQRESDPIEFSVLEETEITVVVGWEQGSSQLGFTLTAPSGEVIGVSDPLLETDASGQWIFGRLDLRNVVDPVGIWRLLVYREDHSQFDRKLDPDIEVDFFASVIATGGARIVNRTLAGDYRIGDVVNPVVALIDANGEPVDGEVVLTITEPDGSLADTFASTPPQPPDWIAGDHRGSYEATLVDLETAVGDLVKTIDSDVILGQRPEDTGTLESPGRFGVVLSGLFRVDGTYTFHAKATYGAGRGTRELKWSIEVAPKEDPNRDDAWVDPRDDRPHDDPHDEPVEEPRKGGGRKPRLNHPNASKAKAKKAAKRLRIRRDPGTTNAD